ncbi:transposase [Paenibacillus macerans]|uniref:transposase n=1 Tax=Paenibacillus macerans TaxID=44252 RepID=UPI0022E5D09D|nr:transposase [Paenibacillus macerans]
MEANAGTELQPFSSRFNSEQDCMEALIAMKWPSGFVCPRCAHTRCSRLTSRHIPLFECGKCKHQTSPLVGTIFEGTHLCSRAKFLTKLLKIFGKNYDCF